MDPKLTLQDGRRATQMANFSAMNRMPGPEGLIMCRGEMLKGYENVWYEYVPKAYTGEKPVPLIVQVHGGGGDGRRWANETGWHFVADQEGFIVIYPNSIDFGTWMCDDRDTEYLTNLIDFISKKYNIDTTRVYMQGMSNGDMMSFGYAIRRPDMLAAGGFVTGPSPNDMVPERSAGALPVVQMRGEKDIRYSPDNPVANPYELRHSMNTSNRELWMRMNETDPIPDISIRGRDNFVLYHGKNGDVLYWELKDMGHREPANCAQVFWDYCYSGYSRVDGKIIKGTPNKTVVADPDAFAVAAGSNKMYRGGAVVEMDDTPGAAVKLFTPMRGSQPSIVNEMLETPSLYVPAGAFAAGFDAAVEVPGIGDICKITLNDGKTLTFFDHGLIVMVDGEVASLNKPCANFGGVFYLPLAEVAGDLLGKFVSYRNGAAYVSEHYAALSYGVAEQITNILGGKQLLDGK